MQDFDRRHGWSGQTTIPSDPTLVALPRVSTAHFLNFIAQRNDFEKFFTAFGNESISQLMKLGVYRALFAESSRTSFRYVRDTSRSEASPMFDLASESILNVNMARLIRELFEVDAEIVGWKSYGNQYGFEMESLGWETASQETKFRAWRQALGSRSLSSFGAQLVKRSILKEAHRDLGLDFRTTNAFFETSVLTSLSEAKIYKAQTGLPPLGARFENSGARTARGTLGDLRVGGLALVEEKLWKVKQGAPPSVLRDTYDVLQRKLRGIHGSSVHNGVRSLREYHRIQGYFLQKFAEEKQSAPFLPGEPVP